MTKPKLSPIRYTGRHLPHEHTSYGMLAFVAIVVGVLLAGISIGAAASIDGSGSVSIRASVLGKAPVTPPTIIQPVTNSRFTNTPIDISGTCHQGLLVNIYKNQVLAGATLCSAQGTYSLPIDLFIGKNDLIAREYTSANLFGPDSLTTDVYFDISSFPINVITGNQIGPNGQLIIESESLYKGINTGDELSWPIQLLGGTPPYALSIDWGDGVVDLVSRSQPGPFNAKHVYAKSGGYHGMYIITLKAVDAGGNTGFMQLVTLVNSNSSAAGVGSISSGISKFGFLVAWPLWFAAVLMIISFWLGERREKHVLSRTSVIV